MKKFNMKLKIRKLSAVLLASAVAATAFLTLPFVASAATLEDFANVYDAYFSSNMQSVDPTPEDMTNHWRLSTDGTRMFRKDNDSSWTKCGPNMAILYLKETYNDFYLTTQFSVPKDPNTALNLYFGIGAEKGKSWANDTATSAFALHHSGGLLNGKTGDWITGSKQSPSDKLKDKYDITGVHTLQLRVLDKVYTAWVDGIQVGSGTLSNYKEGYIWFGADDQTVTWGIPTVNADPNTISDFENVYDAYYSSNMKTVDPAPETMTNHWGLTSDTTRLSRKTNDSNWTRFGPNMAILYLKKTYNNFDLTTTFSIPGNSDYDVYFGVGAEKGKSWANDNAAAFTLHRSGGLVSGKAENWITGNEQTPADKISDYNETGVHTLRLKVLDKVYTAWVDDIQVGSGTLSNYTEGYVWFGADDMTATWGIPTVTELKSISDYENVFDAYYSEDLTTTDPTPVDMRNQWETAYENGVTKLYRKAFDDEWNSNTTPHTSLLYYKARKYYNFEMETKFSHITNLDNLVAFFGFGAEKGVSWENNKGDTVLSINPQFGAIVPGKSTADGSWVSKEDETLKAQNPNYDMNAVHTLKIRMVDRNYTVWIDGYKVASGRNASYTGGYIYFGSNAYKTYFDMPTVTELPNTELLKYDVNGDNKLDSADVVFLRKVLLGIEEANQKCDISGDKKLNILDLIAMKKVLA